MKTGLKSIAIALSGGIDSLVSGYILKQHFPHVFGIHFSTGYENNVFDLSPIAKQLDIDIKNIDLSSLFEKKVVNYFINTYLSGKTPNPCIICNKTIKFGALLEVAESYGAEAIATGHYAKILYNSDYHSLVKGIDNLKEQSYFLSLLSEKELSKIVFPLGNLTKVEVKKLAHEKNLIPLEKKESQDICFLKNESIDQFINSKINLESIPGDIITNDGKIIGTHKGLYNFTIGQRRGINCPSSEPYYVKEIDSENNVLVVCFKNEMLSKNFSVTSLNWIEKNIKFPLNATTKIRYNHKQSPSILTENNNSKIIDVTFLDQQFAITPGQTAVFYDNNVVLGSGIII